MPIDPLRTNSWISNPDMRNSETEDITISDWLDNYVHDDVSLNLCYHKWKIISKIYKLVICAVINCASCNPFVVTYLTLRQFHIHPTTYKS